MNSTLEHNIQKTQNNMYADTYTDRSQLRCMGGSGWVQMGAGSHKGMQSHKHGAKGTYIIAQGHA